MANHLVVLAFRNSVDRASEVFEQVKTMVENGRIHVEAGAVAVRDHDGNAKLRENSEWTAGSGAGWGSFWGLLIGLAFAGPIAGLLGGMGLGALLGGTADHQLDQEFMHDLAEAMKPGDSALLLAVPEAYQHATLAELKDFGGVVVSTRITEEAQANLHQAVEHAEVAAAAELQAEHQWRATYDSARRATGH